MGTSKLHTIRHLDKQSKALSVRLEIRSRHLSSPTQRLLNQVASLQQPLPATSSIVLRMMEGTQSSRRPDPPWRRILSHHEFIILFLFAIIVNLAIRLLNLPLNRIMELRYCRDCYSKHDPSVISPNGEVEESLCKVSEIQQKLAWLGGSIDTLIVLCDLLVTLPFSAISDRLGRKSILFLNSLATTAMFAWLLIVGKIDKIPVEAMIAAPLLTLFGGGSCVLASTVFAYLIDIASDVETRMIYFSYLSSISYVFALLGPVLASATMSVNLWLPFYLGLGLSLGSLPILLLLPRQAIQPRDHPEPCGQPPNDTDETAPLISDTSDQDEIAATSKHRMGLVYRLILGAKTVCGRPNFLKLLGIGVLLSIAGSNTAIYLLYLSKKHHQSFTEVGYLLSVKAAANVVLLVVIIPASLKAWLRMYPIDEIQVNFYGLEINILLSATGRLCLALATELWVAIIAILISGFGTATGIFLLSLVKSPLASDGEYTSGRDFSIVFITRTVGELFGIPLVTVALSEGKAKGDALLGLPYFLSCAFYLLVLGATCYLHRTSSRMITYEQDNNLRVCYTILWLARLLISRDLT